MEAGKSSIESTADDIATVLDAAGAERVTLFDFSNGGSTMYAATYPDRVRSLILVNLRVSFPELEHMSVADRKRLAIKLKSADVLSIENPRVAHDPLLRRWWERAGRLLNSPAALARHLEDAGQADYELFFPAIKHPALVLHRRDNRVWDIGASRAAAAMIPGARFVELPGAENDIFLGDTAPVLAEIEQFLAEPEIDIASDRPLATVLFTDIVSSTEQLAERGDDAWRRILDVHDRAMDRIVTAHRGRVVRQTGDGILATFDGPARAVHCAAAMLDAAQEAGVTLRAGLHTGEIELRPPDIAGIAVHIASRVADLAGPQEILVSRTVVDLTAGSGLQFEPHGEHELKGVPGSWPLFSAQTSS
jgi:class 3 adenylate cyclase